MAATSRQRTRILTDKRDKKKGDFVQVARQGNPLFNEALVAIADKDLYSRTSPTRDEELFAKYATSPELVKLINALVFGSTVAPETNRTDIAGIFIPDLSKWTYRPPGAGWQAAGRPTRQIPMMPVSRGWASSGATR